MSIRMKKAAVAILCFIAAAIVFASKYITNEFFFPAFIVGISCLIALFAVTVLQAFRSSPSAGNFLALSTSLCIFLFLLEIGLRSLMPVLPDIVQRRFFPGNIRDIQLEKIEIRNSNPYAKFKPNVCIHEGLEPAGDVIQSWCTDARGFKNRRGLVDRGDFTIVAAGDSFIEGMGMDVDESWSSMLTDRGIPTYNLGVQGYAPTMSVGAIRHFGLDLDPELMILGCSTCVLGDRAYRDPETDQLLGGMTHFIAAELNVRNRARFKFATSALVYGALDALTQRAPWLGKRLHYYIDWDASELAELLRAFNDDDPKQNVSTDVSTFAIPDSAPALVRQFASEIRHYATRKATREELNKSPIWDSVRTSLLAFRDMAESVGAKPVVIHFPHRGVMYYEAFVSEFPSDSFFKLDPQVLREFATKNRIDVIDLYAPLIEHIKRLGPDADLEAYPYFSNDGHMNRVGQRILADTIEKYVRESGIPIDD